MRRLQYRQKVNLYTDEKVGNRWEGWIQMRGLVTDEKVGYRWEDCNTDKKLICLQMRRYKM